MTLGDHLEEAEDEEEVKNAEDCGEGEGSHVAHAPSNTGEDKAGDEANQSDPGGNAVVLASLVEVNIAVRLVVAEAEDEDKESRQEGNREGGNTGHLH